MEFGRISKTELASVDFRLPDDPVRNAEVLSGKSEARKIYVGMTQWGREEWVGELYPPKTKQGNFLSHYVQHFNCVELNATHYTIYDEVRTRKWGATIPNNRDFKFCPKLFKGISHQGSLNNKKALLEEFVEGVKAFDKFLGPIFIQLSENFSAGRKRELFEFLETLPAEFQFFLEMRHPDLLSNVALFDYLQSKNIGAVITDTAGRRDSVHMNLTVPKTMIRFICNDGHPTDYTRIDEWAERLKLWLDKGIQEIYFFVHMKDETKSLSMADTIIEKFNAVCKLDIPRLPLH